MTNAKVTIDKRLSIGNVITICTVVIGFAGSWFTLKSDTVAAGEAADRALELARLNTISITRMVEGINQQKTLTETLRVTVELSIRNQRDRLFSIERNIGLMNSRRVDRKK